MSDRRCITINSIMGQMARWVAEQAPFNSTRGVDQVNAILYREAGGSDWDTVLQHHRFRATFFGSWREIEKWIRRSIEYDPLGKAWLERWNTAYQGHFSDPNAEGFQTSSRFDGPQAAYDFIDIDALLRNVAMSVWRGAADHEESIAA